MWRQKMRQQFLTFLIIHAIDKRNLDDDIKYIYNSIKQPGKRKGE